MATNLSLNLDGINKSKQKLVDYLDKYKDREPKALLPCTETEAHWKDLIEPILTTKYTSVSQLEAAISKLIGDEGTHISFFRRYFGESDQSNENTVDTSNGSAINALFQRQHAHKSDPKELQFFLDELLPFIQKLALSLPEVVPELPLLVPSPQPQSYTLTKHQCAVLLANAFFCTFDVVSPSRFYTKEAFPEFSFRELYLGAGKVAPIFVLHYFKRIYIHFLEHNSMPQGEITITRQSLGMASLPKWEHSQTPITNMKVDADGTIEDSPAKFHVDFANEYIGGGVLHGGCVQEEIMFMIKPECLVSLLFCARMGINETITITGAERYSNYAGYGMKLKFAGDYTDNTPRDENGNIQTVVIAMDATVAFSSANAQYMKSFFLRDLNKAFIGFRDYNNSNSQGTANTIATGNWGCGAFGGDKQLKSLQQLLAASEAKRELMYYTFKDAKLQEYISNFVQKLVEKNATVGLVFRTYFANLPHLADYAGVFDMILSNLP